MNSKQSPSRCLPGQSRPFPIETDSSENSRATKNTQIIGGERRKCKEEMSRVNSSSTRVRKRDKEYLVLNSFVNPTDMNSKQSPSRCLLFLSLKPAATTSRIIHEKTSQNDIVALHQPVHLSLAAQPKDGTRSLQANTNGWSREINQNDDALTNPNDILKVTSASLPPAGSPVATHYSQQPLTAGSIRNTQNTAFQLNETTSLHFYDWFPKPAACHSKLTHLLIQQSITQKFNSASAQSADNSADNSAANSAVNSAVNSALPNENSAFGDENPDLAHEFQQLLHAYSSSSTVRAPFVPIGLSHSHSMLAGFTTEEAKADTIADQELKRVNRIFEGLNEGIWPKSSLGHQTKFNELFSLDRSGGSNTGLMRKYA
ncbi:hypothetical protein F511_16753 [Dorcoceras hygrometricum]|uniref:Uncharacterized protein n=1 Tax=Dorcoceras hygrometricum TaxID=472368 RepID=A0A2Z7AUW4_9LAMI|nr:hypothetical protein F511_16753 [Dorcoceras hygrometricum]